MRRLTLAIACVLALAACAPAASSPTNPAPAAKPAAPASNPTARPASPAVEGIKVTVDGQPFALTGEDQVTRQVISGVTVLRIGKNPSPSALVGGNGVMLEMQTLPGKEALAAGDIAAATFTVWKGVEFSYMSQAAMPGRPMEGLVLSQASGKLVGSFETDLSGKLGKLRARIDFGVPMPR